MRRNLHVACDPKNGSKKYGSTQVIHGINLAINKGEFCVFVGPSGCGKSTLLRMIAGLEETTSGSIGIGEVDVTSKDPADRGVAMVFQTYALYPHMSVRENMSFGLKMNGVREAEIAEKVSEASRILKLDDCLDRKPKALSGGQRQRVAIGRAIVRGPEVFLFDEPLSNLDAELRVDMRVEIARLHQQLGSTMIYVTHDQVGAMTLADKIVVLRAGRIEQIGAPLKLYLDPDNRFVAGFIGSPAMNFVQGISTSKGFSVPALDCELELDVSLPTANTPIEIGIRPEHIQLDKNKDQFRLEIIERLGGVSYMYLEAETGERIIVEDKGEAHYDEGTRVGVHFESSKALVFDKASGNRLR